MAHYAYDPAKQACDPLYHPLCAGYDMCQAGPGGNRNNIENNEKGILETGLQKVIARNKRAELKADHPRVGIYADGNTD